MRGNRSQVSCVSKKHMIQFRMTQFIITKVMGEGLKQELLMLTGSRIYCLGSVTHIPQPWQKRVEIILDRGMNKIRSKTSIHI